MWETLLSCMALVCVLGGCATTPQPVRYECPPRLMRHWQFVYCMTGPSPWRVDCPSDPSNRLSEWCRYKADDSVLVRFIWLRLPGVCEMFDADDDSDVDLEDYQEVQNNHREKRMGYYLDSGQTRHKAEWLVREHGGKIVDQNEARVAMDDPSLAVVVVVNNGLFEAAGFADNIREFEAFTMPDDMRPRKFVVMDRELCKRLSGFKGQ